MCWNGQGNGAVDDPRIRAEYSPYAAECVHDMTDAFAGSLSQPYVIRLSSSDPDQTRLVLNRFFYPMAVSPREGADRFDGGCG